MKNNILLMTNYQLTNINMEFNNGLSILRVLCCVLFFGKENRILWLGFLIRAVTSVMRINTDMANNSPYLFLCYYEKRNRLSFTEQQYTHDDLFLG